MHYQPTKNRKGRSKMRDTEIRTNHGVVELRATDGNKLVGYGSVFNRLSQNLGGFVERVDPAAFNKTLQDGGPVYARFNHDSSLLLGTTEAGTLRLNVDGTGLQYEVDLPDTTAGRDVRALAARGDLRHSSFAFRTIADEWDETPDGFPLRTLLEVKLVDVAPVTDPAYRDTTTGLRSFSEHFDVPIEEVKKAVAGGVSLRSLLHPSSDAHGQEERNDDGPRETHPPLLLRKHQLLLRSMQ
jgi:HK97 family phage prohead protease